MNKKEKFEKNLILSATYGSPDKPLKIGGREIQCYVLENGKRVLSGKGLQEAVGLGKTHGAIMGRFIATRNINPFISSDLARDLKTPYRFTRPGMGGSPAKAYEATILPRLCSAILEARKHTNFTTKQNLIADQCEMVIRALSNVGIIGLIDEITGYQNVRERDALQALLDKYLEKELAAWAKRFPDDFYRQIFRLKGWVWQGMSVNRPSVVGKITNDIVYNRLAPGILKELKTRTPKDKKGRHVVRFHQWLTDDVGHPALAQHLYAVIALMKASNDWKGFYRLLQRALPKKENVLTD